MYAVVSLNLFGAVKKTVVLISRRHTHYKYLITYRTTDKRTDVWSEDFIISKINSGLWAVVWAGL